MATLVASLSASPREAGDEGGFSARGSSSGQPSRGHRVGEAETEVKGLAWGSHLSLMLKAFGLWAPVPRGGLAGEDRPWGCPSLPPSLEGASPAATAAPKPRYPSPQVQVRGAGPGPVAAALGLLRVPQGGGRHGPAGPSGSPWGKQCSEEAAFPRRPGGNSVEPVQGSCSGTRARRHGTRRLRRPRAPTGEGGLHPPGCTAAPRDSSLAHWPIAVQRRAPPREPPARGS